MKRLLFFFLLSFACMAGLHAQSRMPEIKIEQKEQSVPDSLNFDERPYFLLIEQSEKAVEAGDYDSAALRLIEAMSVEPDNELNVALMSNLGMIYYYDEKDSLALAVLDRAIERAPKLIAPREGRARILVGMGRDKEAYTEYANIIAIDSINTDARFVHGMMSLYDGRLDYALADIAVLERVIPASSRTRLINATMYSMTGREIEAISLFRKLIETEPAPEYFGRMIACQLAIDNLGDASDSIGQAMKLYPDDAELYYYRAVLNKRRYMNDEAHRDARRAIELGADPKRVRAVFDKDAK